MWIPPEDRDPVLLHAPTRKSIGVFGAVCAEDGRLVVSRAEKFCNESFLRFLGQIVRHKRKNRKMILILDNATYHHARALKPWLKKHRKALALDFLPPYSPELNSIERVWKLTRRMRTHNRYFADLEEIAQTVLEQFEEWRRPNKTLKRLCAIN